VTPQQQTVFHQLLQDFINFATGGNVPPLLQQIESWLGIVPPQGNPYRLLKGAVLQPDTGQAGRPTGEEISHEGLRSSTAQRNRRSSQR
jgi:hypothetical protein